MGRKRTIEKCCGTCHWWKFQAKILEEYDLKDTDPPNIGNCDWGVFPICELPEWVHASDSSLNRMHDTDGTHCNAWEMKRNR